MRLLRQGGVAADEVTPLIAGDWTDCNPANYHAQPQGTPSKSRSRAVEKCDARSGYKLIAGY